MFLRERVEGMGERGVLAMLEEEELGEEREEEEEVGRRRWFL